jgi:hypothetical protein
MANVEEYGDLISSAESPANSPHAPRDNRCRADAILTHPAKSEGLSQLLANIPTR